MLVNSPTALSLRRCLQPYGNSMNIKLTDKNKLRFEKAK